MTVNPLKKLAKSLHKKIMSTNRKLEQQYKEKSALEETISSMKQTLYAQEDQIQKGKQQLEGMSSRLKLLEDMRKGYEGFNRTVKEVLTACQSNSAVAHKVCGVVASLISVPKEYETAIETVLGGSLQHIVTEDEEDAKYLINFLRKNNYGRATFLPISSVRGRTLNRKEQEVLNMQGCCGIASQLVSCDPKYRGILDNLLGRVVIAEDMDSAILMARRFSYAFRIVTLVGDIVNPGGSMTGGSSAVRGISILGRRREIGELQKEIESRRSALTGLESQREELLVTYQGHKDNLSSLEAKIKELEQQKASEEESLHHVSAQKAQVDKELLVFENERQQLNKDLEDLNRSISQVEQELLDLEERNASINEWARESESYLKEKLETRETFNREYTEIRIKVAAVEQEIQGLNDQHRRILDDINRHKRAIESKRQLSLSNNEEIKKINESILEANSRIKEMETQSAQLQSTIEEKEQERVKSETRLQELEKDIREWNQVSSDLTDRKYRLEVQCSRYEVELENYQNNIWEEYEITYNTALQYKDDSLTPSVVNQQIQTLKKEITALGDINVNAIEEYKRVSERYDFLNEQRADLINAKDNLKDIIKEITSTMEKRFKEEFAVINKYFDITFKQLFGGGHAQLVLEDPDDVLNCGIEIIAQPPGKKLQSLSLLSGGERALTAIAILFAILKHKPTPFCILDEIDAALDDSNVDQFGKFIKKFSEDTQFVIITHRKGTMEVSDIMYGIAMEEKGVSKLVSVKFDEMVS
jgi:chromosome segregation protein